MTPVGQQSTGHSEIEFDAYTQRIKDVVRLLSFLAE
jgi:hypothetical protein